MAGQILKSNIFLTIKKNVGYKYPTDRSTKNVLFRATHPKAWCAARRAFPSNKLQTIQAETFAKLMERGRLVRILIQTEIRI